jgi:hypothetical protein
MTIARRVVIERAVVERLVSGALFFHGYSVRHSEASASRGQRFAE